MNEYIKREDAIEQIRLTFCKDCNSYNGVFCRSCAFDDAMSYIEDFPSADVAPREKIVRDVVSDIKKIIHNNAVYHRYGESIGNYITLKAVDALLQDYLKKYTKQDKEEDNK